MYVCYGCLKMDFYLNVHFPCLESQVLTFFQKLIIKNVSRPTQKRPRRRKYVQSFLLCSPIILLTIFDLAANARKEVTLLVDLIFALYFVENRIRDEMKETILKAILLVLCIQLFWLYTFSSSVIIRDKILCMIACKKR